MKPTKNPVIKTAYEKGRSEGYQMGLQHGELRGIKQVASFFNERFLELEHTSGIGPKTLDKMRKVIGEKYFLEVESDGS